MFYVNESKVIFVVVEGDGGGSEGVPSGTSRTNRKVLNPLRKENSKAWLYKDSLKISSLYNSLKNFFSLFIKKDKKITKPKA